MAFTQRKFPNFWFSWNRVGKFSFDNAQKAVHLLDSLHYALGWKLP
jgi:hypothetical protein